jgi:hypothetical protein
MNVTTGVDLSFPKEYMGAAEVLVKVLYKPQFEKDHDMRLFHRRVGHVVSVVSKKMPSALRGVLAIADSLLAFIDEGVLGEHQWKELAMLNAVCGAARRGQLRVGPMDDTTVTGTVN